MKLKNIGSHKGDREYEIESGKITIFEGPNSAGKSTIIKSIAVALSHPIASQNLVSEGIKFGIMPMKGKEHPLVNIFEDKGSIDLSFGGEEITVDIMKSGEIISTKRGNEKFLYSSTLLKNSKIQEALASGNDDFAWIVSEMSMAGKLLEYKEIVGSHIRSISAARAQVSDISSKIKSILEEIQALKEKKIPLLGELEAVRTQKENVDISDYPEIETLNNEKQGIQQLIRNEKTQIDTNEKKKRDIETNALKLTLLVKDNKRNIEENIKQAKEIDDKLHQLKGIEIDKLHSEITALQEKIQPLKEQRVEHSVYRDLFSTIFNARLNSISCPICESKFEINKVKIEKKLKELDNRIDVLIKKIREIEIEISNKKKDIGEYGKISDFEKQLTKIKDTIKTTQQSINKTQRDADNLNSELANINDNLVASQSTLKQHLSRVEEIEEELKQYDFLKDFIEKERDLSEKIQDLDQSIAQRQGKISMFDGIDVLGIKVPVERAKEIIPGLLDELDRIDVFLSERISEQQVGAGRKFNDNIKLVMKELSLDDFEDIFIDLSDWRLRVIRKGGMSQPLGALGGAERAIIGGVLQISCKQTYLKGVPFFIGDDVILEFDSKTTEKFQKYLKRLAIEEDLFVVITKISQIDGLRKTEI